VNDSVLLIRATPQGQPQAGGPDGHFVRCSSFATTHPVNQLHIGGWYPDFDCAEGVLISALEDRGLPVPPAHTLEQDAGTNPSYGTGWNGLIRVAAQFGLQPTPQLPGDPPPGWLMNPAWGGVLPPATFPAYLAASQHEYVQFQAPIPSLQPAPIPFTEDDDVGNFAPGWNAKRPGQDDGDIFVFDACSGHVWHHYEVGAVHKATEDLGVPVSGGQVVGVTGLYTGIPTTFIACRALVKTSDGGMHVYEKAGNYKAWTGWGAWVQSG